MKQVTLLLITVLLVACKPPKEAEEVNLAPAFPNLGTIVPPNLATLFLVTPEMLDDVEFSHFVLASQRTTLINSVLIPRYGPDMLSLGLVLNQEPEMITPLIYRWRFQQTLNSISQEIVLTSTTLLLQNRITWVLERSHPIQPILAKRFDGFSNLEITQGEWRFYATAIAGTGAHTSTIVWQQSNNFGTITAEIRILENDPVNAGDEIDYTLHEDNFSIAYRFQNGRSIAVISNSDQSGRFSDSELDANWRCWGQDLRNNACD